MDIEKSQRVPPFNFFSALWDFFPKMKIFVFFNFFMFCDRMDVEKPQRVPLLVFRHCETLARQGLALAGPGAPLGPFFWVCNFFGKFFFQKISIFEYCKRVLDTWKSFCYFWALDMAPTWAGPGLFFNEFRHDALMHADLHLQNVCIVETSQKLLKLLNYWTG